MTTTSTSTSSTSTTITSARLQQISARIREFDLGNLFREELGWDRARVSPLSVVVGEQTYTLTPLAQKREAVVIFQCAPDSLGGVPDQATRRRIEAQVEHTYHEHVIVFVDRDQTTQVWQWVKRQPGRALVYRNPKFYRGQSGEALAQRINELYVDLLDEERLTLTDVLERAGRAFDVEKTTRKFYDRFKVEHGQFVAVIDGIASDADRDWYASLMLNRLMFTWFIQKKGFLDGDTDYLRNRLARTQQRLGADQFHSFYRSFLLHFFHDGLGKHERERDDAIRELIGRIPYLNGGLFEVHNIEASNPQIAIPDAAFARIFAFFDAYTWHLDERPDRPDNEINPDVLGYIFEKYINQKQMGAYYTKEDITGYISRNTILPHLLDAARSDCKVAFAPAGEVWRLLADDPDHAIYEPARHGCTLPLPDDIAAGVGDVSQRGAWNRPADAGYALPTETWREHVARRARYEALHAKLAAGAVHEINDLITYNLDIQTFAQDVIAQCEGPEVVRAMWKALTRVTVLDPTCGSGAFLFAALNTLEPLYDACLARMDSFVAQFDREGASQKGGDFRAILETMRPHRNRDYYIRKAIIVNNLYGVDIMAEAVEIAKLRLFLALAARLAAAEQIEPLPDIDFNIRAGNTLVGFATLAEAEQAISYGANHHDDTRQTKIDFDDTAGRVKEHAADLARLFDRFREQQMALGGNVTRADKDELRARLGALTRELDGYLASQYGIDQYEYPDPATLTAKLADWQASHQPFHWFAEFYEIVQERGGFDVIIGNPPYVEYKNARDKYTVLEFETLACSDLYAYIMERSAHLLHKQGLLGMIVPISIASTDGFGSLRRFMLRVFRASWFLNFAERPSKLFTGVEKRLTLWIASKGTDDPALFASGYRRWFAEERETLFPQTTFAQWPISAIDRIVALPKISTSLEANLLNRAFEDERLDLSLLDNSEHVVYYTRKLRYFVQFFDFVPQVYDSSNQQIEPSELKRLCLKNSSDRDVCLAVLNSSLFFWFFNVFSDVRNVNRREIEVFPFSMTRLSESVRKALVVHGQLLSADFQRNS
ncbi:MAG: DNA methyltransferase, partial [Ktedonobacterales bacterium]